MAPKPDPPKKSSVKIIDLISGPQVELYIGPNKHHYALPKRLLCHYSTYFNSCFNGGFAESQTQSIELPDDRVEHFELLLEYWLKGSMDDWFKAHPSKKKPVIQCMDFLAFADKYGFEVVEAMEAPLTSALGKSDAARSNKKVNHAEEVRASDIELVYRMTSVGSPLRRLMAEAALSAKGFRNSRFFQKQEIDVPGFAADLLDVFREQVNTVKWTDPITLEKKTR
ncbi:hypothetical protein F5884DRAFT_191775 [Xylogone sp. PMI_703]|nr:hypothetical protein F5884DRAFT_191775 [Xylogone sp. PMI_703]